LLKKMLYIHVQKSPKSKRLKAQSPQGSCNHGSHGNAVAPDHSEKKELSRFMSKRFRKSRITKIPSCRLSTLAASGVKLVKAKPSSLTKVLRASHGTGSYSLIPTASHANGLEMLTRKTRRMAYHYTW